MAGPATPPPNPLPPGVSLNESLEPQTLVYRFPNADPTNPKQKGVDFTEGTARDVQRVVDPKTGIVTLTEARTGGKWIQNKRWLNPVKEELGTAGAADVQQRVTRDVQLAMEKFESQLKMPKVVTRRNSDGSTYSLDLRDPESFLIHLEIPGIDKHPGLKASVEKAANDLAGAYGYDKAGVSVRVKLNEPPPPESIRLPAEPVSDLALSASEFVAKYPAVASPPAATPENIMKRAQRALAEHTAGEATAGGRVQEHGFAEVNGMEFVCVVAMVGGAIYAISKADDKLEATEDVLEQLVIGEAVTQAAAAGLRAAGASPALIGWLGVFLNLATSLKDDSGMSEEKRLEIEKQAMAVNFVNKRFPEFEKYVEAHWGEKNLGESSVVKAGNKAVQQAYDLLFNTPPLDLKLGPAQSGPTPAPQRGPQPAPAPPVWRKDNPPPPPLHPKAKVSPEDGARSYPLPPPTDPVASPAVGHSGGAVALPPPFFAGGQTAEQAGRQAVAAAQRAALQAQQAAQHALRAPPLQPSVYTPPRPAYVPPPPAYMPPPRAYPPLPPVYMPPPPPLPPAPMPPPARVSPVVSVSGGMYAPPSPVPVPASPVYVAPAPPSPQPSFAPPPPRPAAPLPPLPNPAGLGPTIPLPRFFDPSGITNIPGWNVPRR